jgi:hypothetical protein
MSILDSYKEIVSQVYKLTQLSYQHRDSSNEFDEFLDHLQGVLEHKQQTIHIPPHVEIISEPADNVVVVKDDSVKNITLRHIPPSTEIQEDERLEEEEENELVHESADEDIMIAKDVIESTLEEDIADAEAEGEEVAQLAAELTLEEEEEDDDEDKDLYVKKYKGVKYFVSSESKRVYDFIDEASRGAQVGKLENGKIVLM